MNDGSTYKLFLASKSLSRQNLLLQSLISFTVIAQDADEQKCDWTKKLEDVVLSISQFKMLHAIVPDGLYEGEICFVLTADTLSENLLGKKLGKPNDRQEAIAMLQSIKKGGKLATAFCLHKNIWQNNCWNLEAKIENVITVAYEFDVPDYLINVYFEKTKALEYAGAQSCEGFGMQFLKVFHGSYSAAIGLPLYEVREALEMLGFFK